MAISIHPGSYSPTGSFSKRQSPPVLCKWFPVWQLPLAPASILYTPMPLRVKGNTYLRGVFEPRNRSCAARSARNAFRPSCQLSGICMSVAVM